MDVAGLLLTGGSSRRMGTDKALLEGPRDPGGPAGGETLAVRSARLLRLVARPCLEAGPGCSGLRSAREDPAGSGPLAALAAGGRVLLADGWTGPVLVVATDLPLLSVETLTWLAGHPASGSVVPVTISAGPDGASQGRPPGPPQPPGLPQPPGRPQPPGAGRGRTQPLCARWSAADLATAARLVADGARSLRDLVAVTSPTLVYADAPGGPGSRCLDDADTPADARRLGLAVADR